MKKIGGFCGGFLKMNFFNLAILDLGGKTFNYAKGSTIRLITLQIGENKIKMENKKIVCTIGGQHHSKKDNVLNSHQASVVEGDVGALPLVDGPL
jgi:hypothetical protein